MDGLEIDLYWIAVHLKAFFFLLPSGRRGGAGFKKFVSREGVWSGQRQESRVMLCHQEGRDVEKHDLVSLASFLTLYDMRCLDLSFYFKRV